MLHNIFVVWLSRIGTVRDNMRIADATQHFIAFAAWRIRRVVFPLHHRGGLDVVVLRARADGEWSGARARRRIAAAGHGYIPLSCD
jgi:hypothetical protein